MSRFAVIVWCIVLFHTGMSVPSPDTFPLSPVVVPVDTTHTSDTTSIATPSETVSTYHEVAPVRNATTESPVQLDTAHHYFSAKIDSVYPVIDSSSLLLPATPTLHTDTTMSLLPTNRRENVTGILPGDTSEDRGIVAGKPKDTLLSTPIDTTKKVTIAGIIIVKETGESPHDTDSVFVSVNGIHQSLSPTGEFSTMVPSSSGYCTIEIISATFTDFHEAVTILPEKTHYFVTAVLEKKSTTRQLLSPTTTSESTDTAAIPWTITGTIVDSRFDLAIREPGIILRFDNDTVKVSLNGNFQIFTLIGGPHTFHCTIPGYHPVTQTITLEARVKQPYVVIPTTILGQIITRREITVSADALPLHRTATTSKIDISRKELTRATGGMNDPMRTLQTLPGVTTESDASARLVVRGGDVQESRVFLDGITLLQPYHFGGLRSTFNQFSLDKFIFHKSSFPTNLHNAQSGIIEAYSRIPSNEKLSLEADVNYMQYCFYAGVPMFNGLAGVNISGQGSYADAASKLAFRMMNSTSSNKTINDLSQLMTIPDYQDFSAGISYTPSPKVKVYINEMLNTDRSRFCNGDSVFDVTYNYYSPLPGDSLRFYGSVTDTIAYWWYRRNNYTINQNLTLNGLYHDGKPIVSEPYLLYGSQRKPDTVVNVTYNFYTPADSRTGKFDTSITETFSAQTHDEPWDTTSLIHYMPLTGKNHDRNPVIGKTYFDIDTLMEYKSNYNILYGTAQFVWSDEHLFNLTVAWQKRWWDLDFPSVTGDFGKAIYDVTINQYNINGGWLYTGLANHSIKSGFQLDYTKSSYDVYLVRFLHEIIINGNTNITDFWGPINGDTAITFHNSSEDYSNVYDDLLFELSNRLLVAYKGKRAYWNAGAYLHDSWDINSKLHLDAGTRIEYNRTDHETWISPRVSLRYMINEKNELISATGLYTQNNYDISAIALSEDLKPEKVWHASVGMVSKFLPWLEQKIDIYGKYYYDLLSEIITPLYFDTEDIETMLNILNGHYGEELSANPTDDEIRQLFFSTMLRNSSFSSHYVNDGRGYSFGFDYMLRFQPSDFWHGWISASWGRSFRQRQPGWRVHPFPLERPLLFSIHNYYRLPKQFEIGLKYRYCSGIPYTSTNGGDYLGNFQDSVTDLTIGAYNDSRFSPYQRLDLRFSKTFSWNNAKGHFYTELWNILNSPNLFLLDNRTRRFKSIAPNFPIPIPVVGLDLHF